MGEVRGIALARGLDRLPVEHDRDEVGAVLARMDGVKWLLASVLYGSGLRLMECLRLLIKDTEYGAGRVIVHDGKRGKDRHRLPPNPRSGMDFRNGGRCPPCG